MKWFLRSTNLGLRHLITNQLTAADELRLAEKINQNKLFPTKNNEFLELSALWEKKKKFDC